MAAEAALGAAFGTVFTVLYDTVKEVVGKVRKFKPILEKLESTLNNLAPLVDEIRQLSEQLDLPEVKTKELMKRMEEGAKLVRKCLKIRWWNSCFKVGYSTKLKELDDEIRRFCQEDLQVHNTRIVLKTLEQVKHIVKRVDSLRARDEPPGTRTEALVNGGHNYKGPKPLALHKSASASSSRSIFATLFSCFGYR
ncbi:protein da1-related 5 [Quercus suber]|uniref:Protein da1-related 5 n=1 Tax=Quercus suber TaxID=58331 RepID=A0AAW0MA18_QUESU|nr:protein da1-related 5 [Quercus suber]